jgi:hypothetical protein
MAVGTKIMNRHIDSKITVVSSYTPMQQQHLQAVRNRKTGIAMMGI